MSIFKFQTKKPKIDLSYREDIKKLIKTFLPDFRPSLDACYGDNRIIWFNNQAEKKGILIKMKQKLMDMNANVYQRREIFNFYYKKHYFHIRADGFPSGIISIVETKKKFES